VTTSILQHPGRPYVRIGRLPWQRKVAESQRPNERRPRATPATANLEGEIYKFASKLTWVGIIQANSENEAIEIAAKEFKVAANRLIARPTK
jgi:hypothetical protein